MSIENTAAAEQSVIGSLLLDERCLDEIQRELRPEHFRLDADRSIYLAALSLRQAGAPIDPVTILDETARLGSPVSRAYLLQLMEITPTAANVAAYIAAVRTQAQRDALSTIAQAIRDDVDRHRTPEEILTAAAQAIDDLAGQATGGRLVTPTQAMLEFYDHRDAVESGTAAGYVKTHYQDLDRLLGGGMLTEGMYVLAARPGMGKTTLAINIADRVAQADPVLFVSLEMSTTQLTAKRISRLTGIPANRLLMDTLTEAEEMQVADACRDLSTLPVSINRAPCATVADIGALGRSVPGLRLIVVDYLGKISPDARWSRGSRYEYMTEISGALKNLARTLKVPILVLCQLNRESQNRQDHRPQLSDLRDTGAIEQDADGVIFLHREDYYADKSTLDYDAPSMMDVIVEKNRHGSTGVCRMAFELSSSRLTGTTQRQEPVHGSYGEQMAIGRDPFEGR